MRDRKSSPAESLSQTGLDAFESWVGELCSIPRNDRPATRPLPLLPDGSGRMFHSEEELAAFSRSSELPRRAGLSDGGRVGRSDHPAVPPSTGLSAQGAPPSAANAITPSFEKTAGVDPREKALPPLPPEAAAGQPARFGRVDEVLSGPEAGFDRRRQAAANAAAIASQPVYVAPPLDEVLTSQHWARNRGRLAKTRRTGMGQALRELETLYAAVPWDQLSLMNPKPFSLAEWERRYKAAKAACLEAGKFHGQADHVRRLALEIRNSWRALNAEKALCDGIVSRIDELTATSFRDVTEATLTARYETLITRWRQTLDSLHTKVSSLVQRCLAALKAVASEEDWTRGVAIMTLSRNITQIIGNAQSLADAGFDVRVDISRCADFFHRLTPYANIGTPRLIDGRGFEFHHRTLMDILLEMERVPIIAS
ncbi:hypothetical protein FFK22_034110 [Mycobacterium sp. KBS0706]|uniref:hypothetical protein n=1 Tax=Mycobacterium sp. KBS0706 TaxID=2578109 RepID=UPI00110F9AED|nr:hypothetical protein [Mycobacterium sp. KBS0706]TSD84155.1 hypothetical protein FFK22_034110 [Mycobacterium sp. KBS0706]